MNKQKQNHLKLVAEVTQPYVDLLDAGVMIKINEEANVRYEYIKLKSGYRYYWIYYNNKFSSGRQSLKKTRADLYRHIQNNGKITYESNGKLAIPDILSISDVVNVDILNPDI